MNLPGWKFPAVMSSLDDWSCLNHFQVNGNKQRSCSCMASDRPKWPSNPMGSNGTVSSRFILTYYCDYMYGNQKLHQDVYIPIFWCFGWVEIPFEQLEAMVKRWFLIYPSMLVVVLQYMSFQFVMCFFFHWVISSTISKWHPKCKAVPW